jgi:hypothetical protein
MDNPVHMRCQLDKKTFKLLKNKIKTSMEIKVDSCFICMGDFTIYISSSYDDLKMHAGTTDGGPGAWGPKIWHQFTPKQRAKVWKLATRRTFQLS